MARSAIPSPTAETKRWQAQSDLRTLTEASTIQGDKSRLRAAQSEGRRQMAALGKTVGKPPARKK